MCNVSWFSSHLLYVSAELDSFNMVKLVSKLWLINLLLAKCLLLHIFPNKSYLIY